MRYRAKPVEKDAVLWLGEDHRGMFEFLGGSRFDYIQADGENFYIDHSKVEGGLVIKTLEGHCIARIGEYIVKGIKGEYYPVKKDIFEASHEPVEGIEDCKHDWSFCGASDTKYCSKCQVRVPVY